MNISYYNLPVYDFGKFVINWKKMEPESTVLFQLRDFQFGELIAGCGVVGGEFAIKIIDNTKEVTITLANIPRLRRKQIAATFKNEKVVLKLKNLGYAISLDESDNVFFHRNPDEPAMGR